MHFSSNEKSGLSMAVATTVGLSYFLYRYYFQESAKNEKSSEPAEAESKCDNNKTNDVKETTPLNLEHTQKDVNNPMNLPDEQVHEWLLNMAQSCEHRSGQLLTNSRTIYVPYRYKEHWSLIFIQCDSKVMVHCDNGYGLTPTGFIVDMFTSMVAQQNETITSDLNAWRLNFVILDDAQVQENSIEGNKPTINQQRTIMFERAWALLQEQAELDDDARDNPSRFWAWKTKQQASDVTQNQSNDDVTQGDAYSNVSSLYQNGGPSAHKLLQAGIRL